MRALMIFEMLVKYDENIDNQTFYHEIIKHEEKGPYICNNIIIPGCQMQLIRKDSILQSFWKVKNSLSRF